MQFRYKNLLSRTGSFYFLCYRFSPAPPEDRGQKLSDFVRTSQLGDYQWLRNCPDLEHPTAAQEYFQLLPNYPALRTRVAHQAADIRESRERAAAMEQFRRIDEANLRRSTRERRRNTQLAGNIYLNVFSTPLIFNMTLRSNEESKTHSDEILIQY